MTGITLEFDATDAKEALKSVGAKLSDAAPLLRDIGEYLLIAHWNRFKIMQSPDGAPWRPLSPDYLRDKKKNKNRILYLDGYLSSTLRYQVNGETLLFGSNRPYAAIHHFGGDIPIPARSQQAYFKRQKDGSVGNKFVKKSKSDFAQYVTIGAHKITMPARPWLGTSADDNAEITRITLDYLRSVI